MTLRHQPDDRPTHETEAIRRLIGIARARGWTIDVEPATRFAARITLPSGRRHLLIGADLGLNPSAARRVAEDKAFAAHFLTLDALPVVPTHVVHDADHAAQIIAATGTPLPVVIKPNRAHAGAGLTFVRAPSEVPIAIALARTIDPIVLLQPRDPRPEFRLILLQGDLIAAFEKRPAAPDAPASLAAGATWTERTADVGPPALDLARRAARALDLTFCAVDAFAPDIASAQPDAAILEVNATPGLKALASNPDTLDRLFQRIADDLAKR